MADLITKNEGDCMGTGLSGYLKTPWSFEETVARLLGAGFVRQPGDEYKCSVEFIGTFKGQTFTLYDYKEDRELHIGSATDIDVEALTAELLPLLTAATPQPYEADEYYSDCKGHSWPLGPPAILETFSEFVAHVANLVKDGEADGSGAAFDMPSDDAVETLHSLISWARRLRGEPEDRPEGKSCIECMGGTVVCDTCDECGQRHCETCEPCEEAING